MIVASRLVTRSCPYQAVGLRSRYTGVRGPRHDQQPGLVVDGSTGGPQYGLADPEVVTAQEQVNRARPTGGRRHHHCDHRPCRTATRPRGNVQRHGSLQVGDELLARDGRPVRPPPLHIIYGQTGPDAASGSLFPRGRVIGPLPGATGHTLGTFVPGRITPGVHGERTVPKITIRGSRMTVAARRRPSVDRRGVPGLRRQAVSGGPPGNRQRRRCRGPRPGDVREGVRGCGPIPAWHEPERLAAPHHDQHLPARQREVKPYRARLRLRTELSAHAPRS